MIYKMSNRKENRYNKGSATKNNGAKELQRTKCGQLNLNSTFANLPGPRPIMKCEISSIFIPTQPFVDYDLQCDVAYSNYLQALLYHQFVLSQLEKHTLSLNDQLSRYSEILLMKQDVIDELNQKHKENDIKYVINEFLNVLESRLNDNLKVLSPEIENGLNKILHVLELSCNQLYLTKVKVLQNQKEYNHLEELLNKCNEVMSKILNVSANRQKYQSLSDCLDHFKTLQEKVTTVEKSVKTLQGDINKLTMETVSDILFENNTIGKNKLPL